MESMSAPEAPPQRPLVSDLHQHLICVLCRGYLVEATAIVECLHSFCRSCIVRNLATSKYCPVCDVAITTAKPSLCIRPDEILQRLVYKIVPNLFEDELKRRKCFYADQPPEVRPAQREHRLPKPPVFSTEQQFSVCLQHCRGPPSSSRLRRGRSSEATSHGDDRRYLSCPARMTIGQLKKFIQMKFDLTENLNVEIFFKDECMKNVYTLVDAAYITKWNMSEPLSLNYLVYDNEILLHEHLPEDGVEPVRAIKPMLPLIVKPTKKRGRKPKRKFFGRNSQPPPLAPIIEENAPVVVDTVAMDTSETVAAAESVSGVLSAQLPSSDIPLIPEYEMEVDRGEVDFNPGDPLPPPPPPPHLPVEICPPVEEHLTLHPAEQPVPVDSVSATEFVATEIPDQSNDDSGVSVQSNPDLRLSYSESAHVVPPQGYFSYSKPVTSAAKTVIILENDSETISSDSLQQKRFPPSAYSVVPKESGSPSRMRHASKSRVPPLDTDDTSYARTLDIIENVENAQFALKNVVCIDADESQLIEIRSARLSDFANCKVSDESPVSPKVFINQPETVSTPDTVDIFIGNDTNCVEDGSLQEELTAGHETISIDDSSDSADDVIPDVHPSGEAEPTQEPVEALPTPTEVVKIQQDADTSSSPPTAEPFIPEPILLEQSVSNEVSSSASPVPPNFDHDQDDDQESQVESSVTRATVETQTGFDFDSESSKSPSDRSSSGGEYLTDNSAASSPGGAPTKQGGKSRERKSSRPVKINRRSGNLGPKEPVAKQPILNTPIPPPPAVLPPSTVSAPPAAHRPALPPPAQPREAPPIKRLRLMCSGFDQSGARPWPFGSAAPVMHGLPPNTPVLARGPAPPYRMPPRTPEQAFLQQQQPFSTPPSAAPIGNGYDQPLELTTKRSRDRKKEEEISERRRKRTVQPIPHLLRP